MVWLMLDINALNHNDSERMKIKHLNLDVLCVTGSLETTLKDLHSLGFKAAAEGASSALASYSKHLIVDGLQFSAELLLSPL